MEKAKIIITIEVMDEEEKMVIASNIHKQLMGNKDYVDSNILLNCNTPNMIDLYIFEECKEVPEIKISTK